MLTDIFNNGQLLIFFASFIFSLSTVCVKVTTLPSFETAFIPSAGCLLLFSLYALVDKLRKRSAPRSRRGLDAPLITSGRGNAAAAAGGGAVVLALTVLRGVLGASNLTLFYLSLEDLDIDTAVTIFFCSPVIAVVIEWGLNMFRSFAQRPKSNSNSPRKVSNARYAQLDPSLHDETAPPMAVIVAVDSPSESIRQAVQQPKTLDSTCGDGMVSKLVIDSSYESDGYEYDSEAEDYQPIDTSISLRVILGCAFTVLGVILVAQPPAIFGLQHSREDFSPAALFPSASSTWNGSSLLSSGANADFTTTTTTSSNLNSRFLLSLAQTEAQTQIQAETQVQLQPETETKTQTQAETQAQSQPATQAPGVEGDGGAGGASGEKDKDKYRWLLLTQPVASHPATAAAAAATGTAMLMALAAAVCNASSFVTVGLLKGRQSAFNLTWWYHLIVCLVTVGPCIAGFPKPFVFPSQRDWLYMLAITVAQCMGQLMLNRGFSLISASRGAAINVMQVLFSYLWELTLLHGTLDLLGAVGAMSVMLGVIVVASDKPKS